MISPHSLSKCMLIIFLLVSVLLSAFIYEQSKEEADEIRCHSNNSIGLIVDGELFCHVE